MALAVWESNKHYGFGVCDVCGKSFSPHWQVQTGPEKDEVVILCMKVKCHFKKFPFGIIEVGPEAMERNERRGNNNVKLFVPEEPMAGKQTIGRRVPDETESYGPGDYGKLGGIWHCKPPWPHAGLGGLRNHTVVEHSDGTITVTPSILVELPWGDPPVTFRWHGYLRAGVWEELADSSY